MAESPTERLWETGDIGDVLEAWECSFKVQVGPHDVKRNCRESQRRSEVRGLLEPDLASFLTSSPPSLRCRRCRVPSCLEQRARPVVGVEHHLLRLTRIGASEQHAVCLEG